MNFEEFYSHYPRKVGKKAAQKSWDKLAAMGTNVHEIIEGAKRYRGAVAGKDLQYVAHPATWLNAARWQDEAGAPEPLAAEARPIDRHVADGFKAAYRVRCEQFITAMRGDSTYADARREAGLTVLGAQMAATMEIHRLRDKLIAGTRSHYAATIREAARRLEISEGEMWQCLLTGHNGVAARAQHRAVKHIMKIEDGRPVFKGMPSKLPITTEHWLSARDRNESRTKSGPKPKKMSMRGDEIVHTPTRQPAEEALYDDPESEIF